MLRKILVSAVALAGISALICAPTASNAQTLPGQILAKGSILAPDHVSSVNFYISAQWKNAGVIPGSQFMVFTAGPGLPKLGMYGPVTSVVLSADCLSATVTGTAVVNGKPTLAMFQISRTGAPLGCMCASLTGGLNFATANAPQLWPLYAGGMMIRKPYP